MNEPHGRHPLDAATRLASQRAEQAERDPEPSLARRFAQIGVLGWVIVVPLLGGLWLGRWLDGVFASGITFAAAGLLLGACLGLWSAWRWMQQQ